MRFLPRGSQNSDPKNENAFYLAGADIAHPNSPSSHCLTILIHPLLLFLLISSHMLSSYH